MKDSSGIQTLESMSQAIWYNQWTLKKFSRYIKGDILEVGCGIGNFTNALTKYGEVWAVDINRDYLRKTKRLVGDKASVGFGNIEKGGYFFKEKKFDCIICLNVLEHIQDDQKVIANLHKLLKVGGNLILLVPVHPLLMGEIDKAIGHYRRYQTEKIISLLKKSKFQILLSKKINFLGAIGWWWAGKVLKNKHVSSSKLKLFNIFAPFFLFFEDIIGTPIGTSILIVAQKGKI